MFQFLKYDVSSQKLRSILILIFLTLIWETDCKIKSQVKMLVSSDTLHPKHFKPGVGVEILPDPIYYNKYIPLVFKLKIPEISSDSLKLNSSFHCANDNPKPNSNCVVAYHFERMMAPLADNIRFSKNVYTPVLGEKFFGDFSCDYIEPHFHHISTNLQDMHLYFDRLKKDCSLAKNLTVVLKNLTSVTAKHITMANNKFGTLLDAMKDDHSDEYKLVHMAGYMALQDAYLFTKYVDSIRWTNAFTSCQSYKLNLGLINSYALEQALYPITKIAEATGYKLSIPAHEHLPHYYKLPISDCILSIRSTKTGNLIIRVLVPVVKKGTKYTKIRLNKIPYLITEGGQKKVCEIDSFGAVDEFLIQETPNGANHIITIAPDCYENELCYLPEQPRRLVVDPCIKGLMNGSLDAIRDFCSFECYNVDNEELLLPIITKLSPNHFAITGSPLPGPPTTKIVVYCDGKFFDLLNPNRTNGVIQVILPCNCEIHYKSQIFKPTRPCDVPFEVHYLTSTPLRILFDAPEPNHQEPVYNATHLKALETGGEDQLIPTDWVAPAEVVMEENSCPSHSVQLTFIWIFLISLIVTNCLLLYVAVVNRLVNTDVLREIVSRCGLGTASSTRSRLEEELPPTQPDNSQWPAGLNRL